MRLPSHPVWFWFVLFSPFLIQLIFWAVAEFAKVSFRPLLPYLRGAMVLALPLYVFGSDQRGEHKTLRAFAYAFMWTLIIVPNWIESRHRFETMKVLAAKWYKPWESAKFSVLNHSRIVVRDIDSVSPWYVEKLGLTKLADNPWGEADVAAYKFNPDGKVIALTTKSGFWAGSPLILFTKKIGRMKDVLSERGVAVGTVERDRQGTRYFEIRDPEGNVIEVVEEP